MSFQWNSQLLAPQSGALSRDTLPIQSSPFTAFEHLSLYIQNAKGPWKHLSLYTVCDTHRATCISDAVITGKSCGEQVLEQRGDLGGIGQEPEADNKNGFRQWAEAGWAEQVIEGWLIIKVSPEKSLHIRCSTGSWGCRKRSWNEQLSEQSLQNRNSRGSKKNFSWSVILGSLLDKLIVMIRLVRIWSSWNCLPRRRWRGRRSWRIRSWAFSRSSSPPKEGKL